MIEIVSTKTLEYVNIHIDISISLNSDPLICKYTIYDYLSSIFEPFLF